MISVIDPRDQDFHTIISCAIRYCLGRRTYMPELVTEYVKPLLQYMTAIELKRMQHDIDAHGAMGMHPQAYGDECDKQTWLHFLSDLRTEIDRRKYNETD